MMDWNKSRAQSRAGWIMAALLISPMAGTRHAFAEAASPAFPSAAFGVGAAQAAVSPDGKQVAYQKKTPKGWRIYLSNLDGSNAHAVTSGPGDDVEPSWRPDGALIAFASNRAGHYDLYAAHPDGRGLRAITHGPGDSRYPQWSPRPFELPYEKDPLRQTVTPRSRANLAPSDLKLLEMLAKDSTDWQVYKDRFDAYKTARYYKLLFVSGQGDKRQLATVREDGRQLMALSTGIPGAHVNPCWERTAGSIGFAVRRGNTSAIYSADYPVTRDLNDGEGTIKFGVDQKALRQSLHRLGVVNGAAQLAWAPSGEYLAAAAGGSLRLFPRLGLKLSSLTYPTGTIAPYGFTWMPDARTALLTVADGGGMHLRPVTCGEPLLDIINLTDFDALKPADRSYLTQNSFVAGGYPQRQMFGVYEETDYGNLPIFVTTDSLLHLHHLVFDYLLRDVETGHLAPETIALVDHYLRSSLDQAKASSDETVIANAKANAAFFAVAARLAMGAVHTGENPSTPPDPDDPMAADRVANRKRKDQKDKAILDKWTVPLKQALASLPPDVTEKVNQEISLISTHGGASESPIFGGELSVKPGETPVNSKLDYSDFIPRGHYTRSEVLRRYFLVSHWLSAGAFRRTPDLTQRALLILSATDAPTMARWRRIEDTVHQFAGGADDQDITSYMAVAKDVYGGAPTAADIADAAKSAAFAARVAELPAPKIAPIAGPSFRFLPAPSTPDAEIMQQMVYDGLPPDVGTIERPRYFALGLDVMSVLGSDRAHSLLDDMTFQGTFFDFNLKETQYANYDAQYQAQREKFAAWTEADWRRSLYTRTLYAMLPLLTEPKDASKYAFTQSPAWTDKNLNAALGTWAELKHDVLPKQPVATELGGEGGISESVAPVQPVGFVEPAPEVYRRLGMLVDAERSALVSQNYLTPATAQRLDTLASLLTMVQSLCRKQETGAPLTAHEIEQLRFYGAYQEHLALVTAEGGETGSTEGNDMAIVADVSSAFSTKLDQLLALEEGVGRALPIYVAVPFQGHRQIARGAVFTYYEFTHPAEDRLTDEKWRALLDTPQAPKTPAWTKSFISHIDKEQYGQ